MKGGAPGTQEERAPLDELSGGFPTKRSLRVATCQQSQTKSTLIESFQHLKLSMIFEPGFHHDDRCRRTLITFQTCRNVRQHSTAATLFFQVIAAEGEQKASRALREAANVIAESSSALQVNDHT